ncbi:MAG TPA: hypothetical protein VGK63_06125 [Candidatus Limnocylindrales bacterium]
MLQRHAATPANVSRRASAMRRQRRAAGHRLYCATNGCASFLSVDAQSGIARCPICGFTRRLH